MSAEDAFVKAAQTVASMFTVDRIVRCGPNTYEQMVSCRHDTADADHPTAILALDMVGSDDVIVHRETICEVSCDDLDRCKGPSQALAKAWGVSCRMASSGSDWQTVYDPDDVPGYEKKPTYMK